MFYTEQEVKRAAADWAGAQGRKQQTWQGERIRMALGEVEGSLWHACQKGWLLLFYTLYGISWRLVCFLWNHKLAAHLERYNLWCDKHVNCVQLWLTCKSAMALWVFSFQSHCLCCFVFVIHLTKSNKIQVSHIQNSGRYSCSKMRVSIKLFNQFLFINYYISGSFNLSSDLESLRYIQTMCLYLL